MQMLVNKYSKNHSGLIDTPTSSTMEFAHYLLGISNSFSANKIELSTMLSEPILHLSFCKSHAIAASKNAWLTRLHNNWPKKTQAKFLMMIEDPLGIPTVSSAVFPFADENDRKVLKVLSSLGVEGYLGLSQQLLKWSGSSGSWLYDCLQETWAFPECHIRESSSDCVQPYCWWWMDAIKEGYWGVNYHHNWILPCSDKGRGLLGFQRSYNI